MNKFEIKKINDKKYFLNMIQGEEDFTSMGLTFDTQELYELYMKLRDIFSTQ
jgi:hypothetical protein